MANYGRELRIELNIRKKKKIKKVREFAERMMKKQEEAEVALKKVQERMK